MPRKYIKKPKDQHKKTGPKGPMKPMDDATFKQLQSMIRIHCTQSEICDVLGMCEQTLNSRLKARGYKNFLDCYQRHKAEGKVSLRRMQWKSAESGNFAAQKWLGQQELGQREKSDTIGELKTQATIDATKLDTETLEAIAAARIDTD